MVASSQTGYDLSVADLQNADIPSDVVRRVIGNSMSQAQIPGGTGMPDISGLLAAILQTQQRASAKYRIYPFNVASGFSQQILPENVDRVSLVLASLTAGGAGFLFDQGALTPIPSNSSDIPRTFFLQSTNVLPLLTAPTNPVTVLGLLGNAAVGVLLEGVA